MEPAQYQQEVKTDVPVLAICYDFDKTLSPNDMQAQGYIQNVGCDIPEFWAESNKLAQMNDMDQNLAYMYMMKEKAAGKVLFTRHTLLEYGAKVALFPGVDTWFQRINAFGEAHGIQIEHYIISSGLKEMIEGTEIAKQGVFKKIYASSFYFDEHDVALWPAQAVNYTNKTQFLFRINKGVLDINDSGVNDSFAPEDMRIPFRNMVYIGDSDTDIPCMKLVNSYGGHSIGVYNHETADKSKVFKMMRDNRIKYFTSTDYSEGGELEKLLQAIIVRTVANEELQSIHYNCKRENLAVESQKSAEQQEKSDAIIALEGSTNFISTHAVIKKLSKLKNWSPDEKEKLFAIAVANMQVSLTLKDLDVKRFYESLFVGIGALSEHATSIRKELEQSN